MQSSLNLVQSEKIQDRIKICHVIIQLKAPGGAERMLMQMLLSQKQSLHNKMVVVLGEAGAWGEELRHAGVTVHELSMNSAFDAPSTFLRLKKVLRSFRPDIVQTWMYHSDFLGGLAAYFAGFKNIIWGIHRTSLVATDSPVTKLVMKMCAMMSSWLPRKIIPVAEAGKKAHIAAGYDASKIEVIPNGFDFSKLTATAEQRAEFRRACGFTDDDLVVGCLGRFHKVKGQDNFVKAAGLILKSKPDTNIKFLMVGKDCDTTNAELMGWINQHNGLSDRMVLLGNRNDVAVCLAGMDIFCLPSRTECFPLCLGEAMAMSLPCISTDVGDAGFLSGGTALLVPPQNEQAMAAAVLQVASLDEAARKEMGARGKERVLAEFAIDKVSERYDAVYRELLSGDGRCHPVLT